METIDLETHVAELRALQDQNRPPGVPVDVVYPAGQMTIPAHVSYWSRERGSKTALVFGDRSYTYAELDDAHRRLATWISEQGVKAGDRVAIYLGNSDEFVIAFLAILLLGAVHVPVNPMFGAAELAYELRDSGPSLVITSLSLWHTLAEVQPTLDEAVGVLIVEKQWTEALSCEPFGEDCGQLDSLAALNYTGGTTGLPKGCQHTQRHMLYTAASAATANGLAADGSYISLTYFPIFWIAGEDGGILLPIVLGGTSVLLSRWDAGGALNAIEQYRVTTMSGTVENYIELASREDIRERNLSSLTSVQAVSFVRKMTPQIRADWAAATSSSGVLRESSYGLTETHTLDTTPYGFAERDKDLLSEPVFCGLPVPGTDIAIVEFGTQNPVALGAVGEIIVRSPSVTTGYWRNPEATEEQLVDGWIHTGDNGRIDEHGCLHYLGRNKEMIKVNGMSVFPAEIEMILDQHPLVESVAVLPVDDPDRGQRPLAFVQLHNASELSADDLKVWCRENMSKYKIPIVRLVSELPMTATGKVRKHVLKEQATEISEL